MLHRDRIERSTTLRLSWLVEPMWHVIRRKCERTVTILVSGQARQGSSAHVADHAGYFTQIHLFTKSNQKDSEDYIAVLQRRCRHSSDRKVIVSQLLTRTKGIIQLQNDYPSPSQEGEKTRGRLLIPVQYTTWGEIVGMGAVGREE